MQYFYKKIAIVTFLLLMYNIEKSSFFFDSEKYQEQIEEFDKIFQAYSQEELYVIFSCGLLKLIVMLCHVQ